jgi:hypothetical protein
MSARRKSNKPAAAQSRDGNEHGGQGRRGAGKPTTDLWKPVPALPDPQPIEPADDPSALVRSLGDPPLPGKGAASGHYLSAVVERAAAIASALAASTELIKRPPES